ncbi:uncharacterized protein BXZ73DRAFT_106402 [Epithele typhae]|uniref:uncharacterized protein n=1 Tax=Epithele typhae TaxID=378194 RepID=UPI00200795CA|nr:uncharacterized protein BXZ73DRAFT_106402 [Epithele typhae]KAH9914894.1 hypothetical protein BXZ73DRAFT_106402 [Epithele typhae]
MTCVGACFLTYTRCVAEIVLDTSSKKLIPSIWNELEVLLSNHEPLLPCFRRVTLKRPYSTEHKAARRHRKSLPPLTTVLALTLTLIPTWDCHCFPFRAPEHARLSEVVEHLKPIRALRALRLTVRGEKLAYSADDLRAIAAAWPELTELGIAVVAVEWPGFAELIIATALECSYTEASRHQVAALEGVADLARGCVGLRVLHLPRTKFARGALDATRAAVAPHRALYDLKLGIIEVLEKRHGRGGTAEEGVSYSR